MTLRDAKAQLAKKAAAKAEKAAAAKPEDEKLAKAAEVAKQAAEDAANGTKKIPETFKDYLQKYVYGCKDQDDLLNVLGGARPS